MRCRWLADFIPDKHQKCVLHKQRAKRVATLLPNIDKESHLEAYKTIHLDIANAYKEIAEIKFDEGRDHNKVDLLVNYSQHCGVKGCNQAPASCELPLALVMRCNSTGLT